MHINALLFLTFTIFFIIQFRAIYTIHVIEYSINPKPFLFLVVGLLITIPIVLIIVYFLPIICIINFKIRFPILRVSFYNIKFNDSIIDKRTWTNKQKIYCVYRC